MWAWMAVGVAALIVVAGLLYWGVIITEGAYWGPRVVTWLYDLGARTYDRIKAFDLADEAWFLGEPLERALAPVPAPLVLDVATGTARVPLALLRRLGFDGRVIGLDRSRQMLRQALRKTAGYGERVVFVRQDATRLPFADEAFDAVTCIEALEFLPHPEQTLREMARVLRPGGVCVVTNRVGWEARLMPGRALSREAFEERLRRIGFVAIKTQIWQVDYDLVWARKPGSLEPRPNSVWLETVLRCPACEHRPLSFENASVRCPSCSGRWIWEDRLLDLMGRMAAN